MTPKEKSKQLVNKMMLKFQGSTVIVLTIEEAKKLALIAVDEIVKSEKLNYLFTEEQIGCMEGTSDDRWIHETFTNFWKKVKKEIKLL